MRRLARTVIIFVFLFPWLAPLAQSASPGAMMICTTSAHKCTHGDECPMHGKKARAASRHEGHGDHALHGSGHSVSGDNHSAADHSIHSGDDAKNKETHYCSSFLKCADEDPQRASWETIELAFTKTDPIGIRESAEGLTAISDDRYSFSASARIDRPPALLFS